MIHGIWTALTPHINFDFVSVPNWILNENLGYFWPLSLVFINLTSGSFKANANWPE